MLESPVLAQAKRPRVARIVADNLEELVAAALICVIGVAMAAQVCLRSFFGAPLSWPEELSQFLFVWVSALGAVGAGKRLGLVRLEAVAEKLPPAVGAVLDYAILVLIAIFLGILGWKGWQLAARTSFTAATLPLTWAWLYAAAPAFAVLMIARLFQLQVLRYRFAFIEVLIAERRDEVAAGGSVR